MLDDSRKVSFLAIQLKTNNEWLVDTIRNTVKLRQLREYIGMRGMQIYSKIEISASSDEFMTAYWTKTLYFIWILSMGSTATYP